MTFLAACFRAIRKVVVVLLVVALLGGSAWGIWSWRSAGAAGASFRTEKVTRDRLVAVINATGTLVPEEVVDVGAQVAGRIVSFGKDLDDSRKVIDYRARVEEGTELARIDDSLYRPEVDIARADLGVAQAKVERCRAELESAKAKLGTTQRDYERARKVGAGALSPTEYDLIRNAHDTARAAVPAAEANLLEARRNVERAVEVLKRAETNLGYCTIRSPVKGVIVDRRVNIGQTVVSSLNAPSLFLIATDLRKMKIWASVNEADIGRIHSGQAVYFKVDAYPNDVFRGQVYQVRLNATMTQNVVTYTVVIDTPNEDLRLLPYLTANVQFQVDQRAGVQLVPNAALRFRPQPDRVAEEYREAYARGKQKRPAAPELNPGPQRARPKELATVWVERDGFLEPVRIRPGLTNGTVTEVLEVVEGELADDAELVTGEHQAAKGGTNNPFAMRMFGGGKKKSSD